MIVNPEHFSAFWLFVGAVAYGLVLVRALRVAQWWRLKDVTDLNVLLVTTVGVLLMWLLNANFADDHLSFGLSLHLLGATLLTLMFGWSFALLSLSVVLLVLTLVPGPSGSAALWTLPWDALLSVVLPVTLSYGLFRLADRRLPNNFFIYIFVCAFFGAAGAMGSVILATTLVHVLSGAFTYDSLAYNYLPYGFLLMLPEAFHTGLLMTIFVVYCPQWVSTFDDGRYLRKR